MILRSVLAVVALLATAQPGDRAMDPRRPTVPINSNLLRVGNGDAITAGADNPRRMR